MPPRRGRGRGGMARQRPPQAIRDAMAEVGMGSLKTFEAMVKASAAANADASRAYYPPLKEGCKVLPMRLMPSERGLVALYEDMRASIARSPLAIRPKMQAKENGLRGDLNSLRNFYFANKKSGEQPPSSPPTQLDSMWDLSKCWVIPELLPSELLPRSLRIDEEEPVRPRKRRRVEQDVDMAVFESSILGNGVEPETDDPEQADPNQQTADGREEDAEDGDQNGATAVDPRQVEEDEDLELGADYQTGARFDDDDGYEENDSGAEEATF